MWLLFVLFSTIGWALVNVLNSVCIHNHIKSPFVLGWIQSAISLTLLIIISIRIDISSSWIPILLLFGITAYLGDLWFFHITEKIDVSVVNGAWCLLSLLLCGIGFIFFRETWSLQQFLGAFFILSGTLLLSTHHKINTRYTFLFILALAIFYLPFYTVQKAALDQGESVSAVFFWMLTGREILPFFSILISPSILHSTVSILRKDWVLLITCVIIVLANFLAEYFCALAYALGPLSLISIISNMQPFFVIGISWLYVRMAVSKRPKELLTKQSLIIKLTSFSIALIGLIMIY